MRKIVFKARFPFYGWHIQLVGLKFDWRGHKFVVHEAVDAFGMSLGSYKVSHVKTGFGVPNTESQSLMDSIQDAINELEYFGKKEVKLAIRKAKHDQSSKKHGPYYIAHGG